MTRRIVITGAGSGSGKATLVRLAAEKDTYIYALDIRFDNEASLDNVRRYTVDLRKSDDIERVYEAIATEADCIDSIIHAAGVFDMDSLIEISQKSIENIFSVNFFAVYRVNHMFLPLLLKSEDARIVITTSELAPLRPLPFNGLYSITKSTLGSYAFSLRLELALIGIKVIVVQPGAINTSLIPESMKAMKNMRMRSKLYSTNLTVFENIMSRESSKTVEPGEVAELFARAVLSRNPKYVYKINNSIKLKLLSMLPIGMQIRIFKYILKERG